MPALAGQRAFSLLSRSMGLFIGRLSETVTTPLARTASAPASPSPCGTPWRGSSTLKENMIFYIKSEVSNHAGKARKTAWLPHNCYQEGTLIQQSPQTITTTQKITTRFENNETYCGQVLHVQLPARRGGQVQPLWRCFRHCFMCWHRGAQLLLGHRRVQGSHGPGKGAVSGFEGKTAGHPQNSNHSEELSCTDSRARAHLHQSNVSLAAAWQMSPLYTPHSTLYILHFTHHTLPSTLHTPPSPLRTSYPTHYIPPSAPHCWRRCGIAQSCSAEDTRWAAATGCNIYEVFPLYMFRHLYNSCEQSGSWCMCFLALRQSAGIPAK